MSKRPNEPRPFSIEPGYVPPPLSPETAAEVKEILDREARHLVELHVAHISEGVPKKADCFVCTKAENTP